MFSQLHKRFKNPKKVTSRFLPPTTCKGNHIFRQQLYQQLKPLIYLSIVVAFEGKFNNEYTFWRKQNVPCGVDFWSGLRSNTGITWIQEKDNHNTKLRVDIFFVPKAHLKVLWPFSGATIHKSKWVVKKLKSFESRLKWANKSLPRVWNKRIQNYH